MTTCLVCFDEMDMAEFRDAREGTETCHKLDCGHAFHTKCVIGVLQQTQIMCPTCNKHKTPEGKARLARAALQARAHIAKNPEVRAIAREQREAQKQLVDTSAQWRKEVRAFAKQRSKELQIKEKREYYNKVTASLRTKKNAVATAMGAIYREALRTEEHERHRRRWRHWSMMHPRVFASA